MQHLDSMRHLALITIDNAQRVGGQYGHLVVGQIYDLIGVASQRGGVAIDQTPIPASTLSPRIPDATRTWASVGVTYRLNDTMSVALTYAHLFLPNRTVAQTAAMNGNALRGNLAGRSEADANAVGIQLNYRMP